MGGMYSKREKERELHERERECVCERENGRESI